MKAPSAIRRAMPACRASAVATWVTARVLILGFATHAQAHAPVATDPDQLAWALFVAINTPPGGGAAGDAAPSAWETWPNTRAIYREDGADPGPARSRSSRLIERFEDASTSNPELEALPNVRHIVAGRMVPGIPDKMDAQRLIESRMNLIAYHYLRGQGLYNLEGQMRAIASGHALEFPRGSIEVKVSWRPIDASDAPRYRTLLVRLGEGEPRLYGLTALNLAAKVLPVGARAPGRGSAWLWASFEHVDNAHRAGGEGWESPSRDAYACPEAPSNCDRVPGGRGLEGTVWQHYRLRGTLTDYVDARGRPQRLGNSELEQGLQSTSSCITCHARSALAVVDGRPRRLPVFETNERRGSIGVPDADWFHANGADYRSLDFVWSLSLARPLRTVARSNPGTLDLRLRDVGDSR